MAELLAGSVNAFDVKGLKLPDGAPHDLGQFYILMDPSTHGDHFATCFARILGSDLTKADSVEVPDALWTLVQGLSR